MTTETENAKYELPLTADEAAKGTSRTLVRNGKKLEVVIPAGSVNGTTVKLSDALKGTDGREGDIIISVRVKAAGEGVTEISDGNFDAEVLKSATPVVVDFWAPWCGPCRMIAPVMEKLSGQYGGKIKFCKINVDDNPASASRYQAMSIPLLVFFKNGAEAGRSVGALPEPALRSKIDAVLA
jgi:thioredoxin 1